eukprot:gene3088-3633_t
MADPCRPAAAAAAKVLNASVDCPPKAGPAPVKVALAPVPQQANSHDCGLYTMAFARSLSLQAEHSEVLNFSLKDVTPRGVSSLRKSVHDLILSLS